MKRRDFLKKSSALTAAGLAGFYTGKQKISAESLKMKNNKMPKRQYGNKDVYLSIVGFGGIVVMNAEQSHADKAVANAVEKGINYFDVAPTYGDAELRLGPALEPFRDDVFLACKTTKRKKAGAEKELAQSLKNLRTDHFDLYQLHAIKDVDKDVDTGFGKNGCMEVFIKAREKGIVKYLGFSAHSEEAALTALERYPFDSILFPVNFATFYKSGFGPKVLEKARQNNAAILALKSLALQKWPENDPKRDKYTKCWYEPITEDNPGLAQLAMDFTLSQPGVTALVPPGEEAIFNMALELGLSYEPMSADDKRTAQDIAKKLNPLFPLT